MDSIKDRAVLVKFTDHTWRGGMIDKQASQKVHTDAGAKSKVGHFWKRLIPSSAISPRLNIGFEARAFHNTHTLPWMEGGIRILPIAMYEEYMEGMRARIAAAEAEERKLFKSYDTWRDEAKRTMGSLYKEGEFPALPELRSKFGLELKVLPLPNVNDWRVDLSADQAAELRKQAEATFADVQKEGVRSLYEGLMELLEHAKERLDDPEAVFRDSLIKNIRDMVSRMAKLNVTGDKELEAVRAEVEAKFKDVSPEALRTDKPKRRAVAKDAAAIMKKMQSYMKAGK